MLKEGINYRHHQSFPLSRPALTISRRLDFLILLPCPCRYAAGAAVQLMAFSIIALQIKRTAPVSASLVGMVYMHKLLRDQVFLMKRASTIHNTAM